MSFKMALLRFGTKIGLVGGALYLTSDYGVWKDSKRTEEIYKEIYSLMAPYVKEVPVEMPELPKVADLTSATKYYWNHGVVSTANFLANLPANSYSLAEKGITKLREQLKDTSATDEHKQ